MRGPGSFFDQGLADTLAYVRGQAQPPTAQDVASALDVPRSVARWRLERLVSAGLLSPRFDKRTGREGPGSGRPAKGYAAVPESSVIDFPPRRYSALLGVLLDALPRRRRHAQLVTAGRRFGAELARASGLKGYKRPQTALRRLCEALTSLGYPATIESASPDRVTLVTPTCPLRPLVSEREEAHALDVGMWEALLEAVLPERSQSARCELGGCRSPESPCRITVELAPPTGAEAPA